MRNEKNVSRTQPNIAMYKYIEQFIIVRTPPNIAIYKYIEQFIIVCSNYMCH